jgi:cation transport ATPase
MLNEIALPFAAGMLLVPSFVGRSDEQGPLSALIVLAAADLGRLLLTAARRRSGVGGILDAPSAQLGESFRDNTRLCMWNRRIGAALTWSRFPLAGMAALGSVWLADAGLHLSIAVGACTLIALSPRAFALATMEAYYAAALRLVRLGGSPRDAEAMERLGAARVFLFEGAGTAFAQEPKVASVWAAPPLSETSVLEVLADLQAGQNSRVALALSEHVARKGIGPTGEADRLVVPDQGISGATRHGQAACGSRSFILSLGIGTGVLEERAAALEESGRRAIMAAVEGRAAAVIGIEDRPEPRCVAAATLLSGIGRHCLMLSTAEAVPAKALAHRCGFADACFETPHSALRNVVAAFDAAGDSPVVIGGTDAIEDVAPEAVTLRVSGDGMTQAAFDARFATVSAIPQIYEIAAAARGSASCNTALAVSTLFIAVGLTAAWSCFATAAVIALIQTASEVASALNRPFPFWNKAVQEAFSGMQRVWKQVLARRR